MSADDPEQTRLGPDDSGTGSSASRPIPPPHRSPDLPERYEDLGLIAHGGQGEVRRVWDHKLERVLAIKILRGDDPDARRRFRVETSLTVSLSHPGIIPVYDRGRTADGRPWFTMKPVDGIELTRAIRATHRAPRDPAWSGRRLLNIFVRICEAVAYAHEQGVVHRDLKPGNVMIGRFGEVWVLDWGLARRLDEPPEVMGAESDAAESRAAESPARSDPGGPHTRVGVVLGTRGYMAPEQARGEAHRADRRSDVYALGGILYAMITGRRPTGRPAPGFAEPQPLEQLEALCRAAMADELDARPDDAEAMRRAVADWLDGARRRREGYARVVEARAITPEITRHRAHAERLRAEAARLLDPIAPYAPEAEKHPGWRVEDAAADARREAALAGLRLEQTLRAALARCPDLREAHRLLADHYRDLLERAEAERDPEAIARNSRLLAEHDDGRHGAFLSGRGRLSLRTTPADARITLSRYVERDRRRVTEPVQTFDAPLRDLALDHGDYLALIEAPGHHPVRCPIHIERGGEGRAPPPGAERAPPIDLPEDGALGPDGCYVPGGWTTIGGDPAAADGLPRRRIWVDGFVIRRFPVTVGEYRTARRAGLPPLLDAPVDPAVPDDHPLTRVDWRGAMTYARWLAARTGRPWRLPHGVEWEKAARGVDGRWWPWGDFFDPSRACTVERFAGAPGPRPVGDAAADESPYGVRDMVGGVREWCGDIYRRSGPPGDRLVVAMPPDDDPALREGRGGAWSGRSTIAHPAGRFAGRPDQRVAFVGFRLARSWP